jgi:hypothetical protein
MLPTAMNLTASCTPWYFPFTDDSVTLCDPWQALRFYDIMYNDIPDEVCSHCLPDCTNTIYRPVVTTLPFKPCDESNLGSILQSCISVEKLFGLITNPKFCTNFHPANNRCKFN